MKRIYLFLPIIIILQYPLFADDQKIRGDVIKSIFMDIEKIKSDYSELDSISSSSIEISQYRCMINYKKNVKFKSHRGNAVFEYGNDSLLLRIQVFPKNEGGWKGFRISPYESNVCFQKKDFIQIYASFGSQNENLRQRLCQILEKHRPPELFEEFLLRKGSDILPRKYFKYFKFLVENL